MGILAIAGGGAVGAVLRYALSGWVQELGGTRFPWGTLAVNAVGSLAIGLIMAGLVEHSASGTLTRSFWTMALMFALEESTS